MTEVLLFNIAPAKAAKIKMLCRKLNISSRTVEKEDFGKKLSALLSLSDDDAAAPDADFSEEMLYLSDFYDAMLSIFLDQLRRKKLAVSLKAVKTESNLSYTAFELFRELSAERAALSRGESAHAPQESKGI